MQKTNVNAQVRNVHNFKKVNDADKCNDYEEVYSKRIIVNGKKQKLVVSQNVKNVKDTRIALDGKNIKLKRVSIGAGYVHAQIKMLDVTGDGKKEIVMLLGGGAAGTLCDVQFFKEKNGIWSEITTPYLLWEDDDISVSGKKSGNIEVKVNALNFVKSIKPEKMSDLVKVKKGDCFKGIRKCAVKKDRLEIRDDICIGTIGNKIGTLLRVLKYDKKKDTFKYVKTPFRFK